ncbi:sigma-70 family RNA polymerase sigma factor [Streptomyces qinzhouensis]|uniref:RNA polymerase sigma factor n=1 Tax=Streptomyces qinzhouensis TaxID=2599401 RepID=A0A5B8JA99_9ACTN|nr:sigma-70 family RNA polymerase sigma factor [Streptomyces qinzhouensis]QDY78266.1 sigma-70 family RNA polymerase sigma factor [Streptomyces qinzhouensis]
MLYSPVQVRVAQDHGTGRRDAQITGWALAAGSGDRRATELFVEATYEDVRRFVSRLTYGGPGSIGTPGGADDLAQETYARALTSLSGFAGRSSARTWLLTIARRVVVDGIRRAAARPRIADTADDWLGAAERAQQRRHTPGFEESVAFRDALRALEPGRRQAFVLTRLLGLSYAEAADLLGCPVGTIRSRVARARRELAEVWLDQLPPEPEAEAEPGAGAGAGVLAAA